MPLYDYECPVCGPFREWRAMSASAEPAPCPTCAREAARSVSVPMLAMLPRNTRIAHERNERSAHEPRVMRREDLPAEPGHHHHHHGGRVDEERRRKQFGHVHEARSHRPWMVGH
ncbi:MAG: zinc ribbon domain-containing protein [Rhodospirillales bacterium]|nr:zinc ribbon domain-containing protein [Rhodospirillales bacterium]